MAALVPTSVVGTRELEMGYEKWCGTLQFLKQAADILLVESSDAMRKFMAIHALTEIIKGVCNHGLQASFMYVIHF